MAKPRDLEGLDCAGTLADAAHLVVAVRVEEVLEHAGGAGRLDDIEPLHDMRVATRRLRAALQMFEPCFRRKPRKRAAKRLKRLARALGERRDRDVAIEYLHGCLDAVDAADRPRLEELIGRLREEQREANEALAPLLEKSRLAKLRRRFDELVEGEGVGPAGTFRQHAARIVAVRLDGLRELAPAALEPAASSAQHEMRIAAKRLRYALEVAAPCLDDAAEAELLRGGARALQSVLGELHDCDVLLPRAEGIDSLSGLLEGRREELFGRFRELWAFFPRG